MYLRQTVGKTLSPQRKGKSELTDAAKLPERYWHCYVARKGGRAKGWAVANDLTFEQLQKQIIEPWHRNVQFVVSALIITKEDVDSIRITQTDDPQSTYANKHDSLMSARGIADMATDRRILPIQQGTDYTSELLFAAQPAADAAERKAPLDRRIFIVHGHDEEMKQTVARALEGLRFQPIMLHEQPGAGRTIIEKFEAHANVGFAVVLLAPDDALFEARAIDAKPVQRARQNVVLELGFFLGKLGRSRVAVIFRNSPHFQLPSDYAGVEYLHFEDGAWRLPFVRELRAAGYEVDANRLR